MVWLQKVRRLQVKPNIHYIADEQRNKLDGDTQRAQTSAKAKLSL